MINCKNSASPLSIIHEDTKLILGALDKANRNPKTEKVILPLVVTEHGVATKDIDSEKATFVGQNDLDLSIDVLEGRLEIETEFSKKFFSDEELHDSFIKKIDSCSQYESSVFSPHELALPFKSN